MPRILSRAAVPSSCRRRRTSSLSTASGHSQSQRCPLEYNKYEENHTRPFYARNKASFTGSFLSYLLHPSDASENAGITSCDVTVRTSRQDHQLENSCTAVLLCRSRLDRTVESGVSSREDRLPPSLASSVTSSGHSTPSMGSPVQSTEDLFDQQRSSLRSSKPSMDLSTMLRQCSVDTTRTSACSVGSSSRMSWYTARQEEMPSSAWGQFVDVAEQDEQLERYRRVLHKSRSLKRSHAR